MKSWYRNHWLRWWKRGKRRQSSAFGSLVASRREWLFDALPQDAAEYQYDIFTKDRQRRLATRLGLATADVYLAGVSLGEALDHVEEHRLERFVIKPNSSHNAIGFRALVRTADGFREVRNGKERRIDQLKRDLIREYGGRGRPDRWILEELLVPAGGAVAPIDDFKFYCFGGRTELIYHSWKLDRKPWKRRNWYTREWEPAVVSIRGPNHDDPRVPANADRLVEVAEHAAAQLAYPFMRVDLYDSSRGVVLGEFTPGPGGRHSFMPEWDERLASLWRNAAADLTEGIRSGRVRPLGSEPQAMAAD